MKQIPDPQTRRKLYDPDHAKCRPKLTQPDLFPDSFSLLNDFYNPQIYLKLKTISWKELIWILEKKRTKYYIPISAHQRIDILYLDSYLTSQTQYYYWKIHIFPTFPKGEDGVNHLQSPKNLHSQSESRLWEVYSFNTAQTFHL